MLLSFKTSNFKSFLDEVELKMTPAPKIKGMDYSIIKQTSNKKEIKALSTSIIYGSNASGKTNIVSAMDVFRNIILNGNIRNREKIATPDYAVWRLELIPNFNSLKQEPTTFDIEFNIEDVLVKYGISIDLGNFLAGEYHRKIIREILIIDNKEIYERKEKEISFEEKNLKKYIPDNIDLNQVEALAINNLDDEELFLCNGFKNLYSKTLYDKITRWIGQNFIVAFRSNDLTITDLTNGKEELTRYYNKIAKLIGTSTERIELVDDEKGNQIMLSVFAKLTESNNLNAVPSEIVESLGTFRFLGLFPIFKRALDIGATLVMDELDASINPMIIISLINIFHDEQINKNGAQLIFNTHNPIFLNKNIVRRDEIKFVEKNDTTRVSELYALSDFGTSGEGSVRKNEDYLKNYYTNKYGAIKFIDLSEVFKSKE